MKRYVLFDLDGTVADNGEGICKSAQYALDFFGIHHEPVENLRRFVGPPLQESFQVLYGFSSEEAKIAVEKYRERYRVKGVYENKLYPGIPALLEELSRRAAVCLATSKPEVFSRKILEMGGVLPCFTRVVGSELDGRRTDKAEVIQEVLRQLGVSETSRKLFVHRNTLVYRLEKIKKLTGLDLREFDHAIVFKVALMVRKFLACREEGTR